MVVLSSSTAFVNARIGKVSASSDKKWRMVLQLPALLTVTLTVAVHPSRRPYVCKASANLTTDGHGYTRMKSLFFSFLRLQFQNRVAQLYRQFLAVIRRPLKISEANRRAHAALAQQIHCVREKY